MTTLLEDSESISGRISVQTMHLTLAHIKSALQHFTRVLDCNSCSSRSDHMMLATVVIKKLVSVLQDVVRVYTQRRGSSSATFDQHQRSDTNHHYHHHQSRENCYNLFIGDYAIDSEVEWAAIVRALLAVLSNRTLIMLERMKELMRLNKYETQAQMLWGAEQRARKVLGSMRDAAWNGDGG